MQCSGRYQPKSEQTELIERLIREGRHSLSIIARDAGVTRQRVHFIKKRLDAECQPLSTPVLSTPAATGSEPNVIVESMKALTVRFTPAVLDALIEACASVNRKDPEDPITLEDFVEECAVNKLVELGLLRKRKR